ncbi:MAG: hypothetical protein ACJ8AO_05570 [Gemmatimonadaceae bacterium]
MTVVQLVDRERSRVRAALLVWGAALALAALAVVLGAGVAALGRARWIALPAAAPFAVWALALGAAAVVGWLARRRWHRDASPATVAAAIERERALRTGALRGAIEVGQGGALGRRAAEQLGARLAGEGPVLAPAHRRRARVAAGQTAAGALVALALLGAATVHAPDGWAAVSHPVRAWRGALLPALAIDAPPAVLRGTSAKATVYAPGRRDVEVRMRATGSAWRTSRHAVSAAGAATVDLGIVDADLTVVVADGRAESAPVVVRVTDRPFVGDVSLHATYPAYLERAAETLPAGEPLRVPRGTVLAVAGRASTALSSVVLAAGADTLRLRADGHRFAGRFVAERGGRWSWVARSTTGPVADVPPALELEVVPDTAPRVEILAPTRDSLIAPGDRVRLSVAAADDHGLASVVLRSWRVRGGADARAAEATASLAGAVGTQWLGDGAVDAAAQQLQPGDALHVVAVATDASPWRQQGTSRELVLRVPSLSEQRETARAAADSAVQAAAAAARAQKALQQRTAESSRARDRGSRQGAEAGAQARSEQSMSYQSAEQARQLAQEQRRLAEQVRQLEQSAKALEKQLRQAGALDSALSARLKEVQQLLAQALTPELAEQLRKLEESAKNLDGDQSRQAMSDLAAQQQRLREQLEKSVEMLKRAALEGAMQTLRDEARDLAKEQRSLADSMGGKEARGDSAGAGESARDLARRSEALEKDVDQLAERLDKERAKSGASQVREAGEHVEKSAEAMERAARQQSQQGEQKGAEQRAQQGAKQNGQQQPGQQQAGQQQAGQQQSGQQQSGQQQGGQQSARQGQQKAAQDAAQEMQQAADQLAQAREQQIGEWKQELTQELDRAVQEMLQLAREQDQLAQQAQQGAEQSQLQARQNALQQGVEKAGERLQQAGQKSSLLSQRSQRSVGDARRKVQDATKELSESPGRGQQAASSMRDAASALNQAAASLVRDRERANSAQSASGFAEMLQQMQDLAKQQGSLNAQSQGIQLGPSGQPSDQARAAARAVGRQQRRVADKLDDVSGGDETGRAEELAKEARQLAQQLERGALDQSVLDRQQRLYRRLLDAGMALEQDERDDDGKRESRAGRNDDPFAPANADAAGKDAARFRPPTWEELRGLSAEERRLVLEYFRRINERQP